MTRPEDAATAVVEAARGSPKPVLAAWMGEGSVAAARARLQAAGFAEFRGPERAVETFAQLAQFYRNQRALLEAPGPLAHHEAPDIEAARALVKAVLDAGRTQLNEREAKALLDAFRIPVNRAICAASVEDAVRAAREVGFPVALKIDSPDIVHKSDAGGVRLQLADEAAVRAAYAGILAAAAAHRPGARIAGVTVETMVSRPHGRELMAGIVRDPVFGPAIAFAAGGIAVEVLRDRVVALPPLNAALAADMVRGTRIAAMLGEFRNLPAVDRAALDAVLLRVSEMACELPELEELDINPLIADEGGVVAVDARVVLHAVPAQRDSYAHLAIRPYPRELERLLRLAGGAEVALRPIRPEDTAMEEAFVAGLSDESRSMRFMSALRSLTPAMLARFTQIDYDREMALVAVQEAEGGERELAVCRYVTLPDGRSCEFAIVVADAWQRRGLGRRMMQALIEVAGTRGLERMVGLVHSANAPMLRLCAELGFVREDNADPHTRRIALALGARASGAPAPARANA
jgi:acetyltransferase